MKFNWTKEVDRISGKNRMVLRSDALPKGSMSPLCADDRLAVVSYEGGRKWKATFWVGYDSINFTAGTAAKAGSLLEQELDKRSIGLFGVDTIHFSDFGERES